MVTTDHDTVLKSTNLTKNFGNGKGVFSIDISVGRGTVIGFVGPNGAGKSTTINILTGLIKPDDGQMYLFGAPYDSRNFFKSAAKVGVMYSELTLDDHLSSATIFTKKQQLLGKDCREQWQAMAKTLELDLHKPIKRLSLGNKKKVGIIAALMQQPQLIIMDEPTSGLDPLVRERFVGLIREAAGRGAAILLSSHDLTEVQEVSDRIVMIKAGKIVLDNRTDQIINLAQRTFQLIGPAPKLVNKLTSAGNISNLTRVGNTVSFQTSDYEQMVKLIADANFYNFFIEKPSLEASFRDYYE